MTLQVGVERTETTEFVLPANAETFDNKYYQEIRLPPKIHSNGDEARRIPYLTTQSSSHLQNH